MNWVYIILELIYCLHCGCAVYSVHSKQFNDDNKNNDNKNILFNGLTYEYPEHRDYKPRTSEQGIWNNYESYQPSIDETLAMVRIEGSTGKPPYYLSYDSGIKTKYQAMEEELIQEQMDSQDQANDQFYKQTRTNDQDRPVLARKRLTQDKYQIESQIKEQQEVNEKHNQNKKDRKRRVGFKGLGGTFGFMVGHHFFPCDKPSILKPDPETGNYIIPENLGYYSKCQYFDEDPRRQFQRRVGSLGKKGFYGYFEGGHFIECPPPKRLEPDTQDPNAYYIPNDIEYEPKCLYYSNNVSKEYDATREHLRSPATTLDIIVVLLPLCLFRLILSFL